MVFCFAIKLSKQNETVITFLFLRLIIVVVIKYVFIVLLFLEPRGCAVSKEPGVRLEFSLPPVKKTRFGVYVFRSTRSVFRTLKNRKVYAV